MATTVSRTSELLERRRAAVARGISTVHDLVADSASGAVLRDIEGREYLDFIGGIGVLNLGHSHPRIVAAVAAQLERFTHTSFQVVLYDVYIELAERLCAIAPGAFAKKAFFVSTGAEAVENAVKISRAYTKRPGIITFRHGYHGRTLLTLAMTGKVKPYKDAAFGPYPADVYQVGFPSAFHGITIEAALAELQQLFHSQIGPDRVAAIVIEPVQGEGGFVPAPPEFLRALRRIADEHGIVLVFDEIQSGFGRTSKMFASEHSGVVPDLMTVAKSLAGGLPLAGVVGRAEIMDGPEPGGLGGTYAGNPLACAAALATLDAFEEERILERAVALGVRLREALDALKSEHAQIVDVRGIGAMLAFELADIPGEAGSAVAATQRIVVEARERGLLLMKAGNGNIIRILVPLVIEPAQLDRALAILAQSVRVALAPATHDIRPS
jgi:4-aminobutyrate aminotransferase/(S)-3-amino-2-methylpropionate transaminase